MYNRPSLVRTCALLLGSLWLASHVPMFVEVEPAFARSKSQRAKLLKSPPDYSSFERRRREHEEGDNPMVRYLEGGLVSAADLGPNETIIEDDPLERGIREIVDDLIPSELESFPHIPILLTDSDAYSAQVTPAGALVIRRGTLEKVQSYDELAFILGHELSHLLLDHFRADENREQVNEGLRATIVAASLTESTSYHHGADVSDETDKAEISAESAIRANEWIFGPSWNRKQERVADELGLELLVDEGNYNPVGGRDVLQRLVQAQKVNERRLEELCGPKSPKVSGGLGRRIGGSMFGNINPFGGQDPISTMTDTGTNPNHPDCRYRDNIFASMKKTHPDPEKRLKNFEDHWDSLYDKDRVFPSVQEFPSEQSYISTTSPGGPMDRLIKIRAAEDALNENPPDYARAESLARAALEGLTVRDPMPKPRYILYKVLRAQGKRDAALHHLKVAVEHNYATTEMYAVLAREQASDGDYEAALQTIEWGALNGDPLIFYPLRVEFLTALGRDEKAAEAMEECAETHLAELCEERMQAAYSVESDHQGHSG